MADLLKSEATKGTGGDGVTRRLRPRGYDRRSSAKRTSCQYPIGLSEMQRHHRTDLRVLQSNGIVCRQHV